MPRGSTSTSNTNNDSASKGRGAGRTGGGRVTPPQRQGSPNRRYTPPITKEQRHSPRWYPFVVVGLLLIGLLIIIGNYAHLTPGGTKNWYLIAGIGSIVAGLVMATYYR